MKVALHIAVLVVAVVALGFANPGYGNGMHAFSNGSMPGHQQMRPFAHNCFNYPCKDPYGWPHYGRKRHNRFRYFLAMNQDGQMIVIVMPQQQPFGQQNYGQMAF